MYMYIHVCTHNTHNLPAVIYNYDYDYLYDALPVYVCECTVGVDVDDGAAFFLMSILSNITMGCIVLGRQTDVDCTTTARINTMTFIGMDVRFCSMKIHDSMILYQQPRPVIVVHLAIV